MLGPSAGAPDEARRTLVTVCYKDETVGELQDETRRAIYDYVAWRNRRPVNARVHRLGKHNATSGTRH